MKRILLSLLVLAALLSGCATTPKVGEVREIHFTQVDSWAQDLTIVSVKGIQNGADVDFSVYYKSGVARDYSFFNPPNGDVIMYQAAGVLAGEGTVTFSISIADLRKIKEATMGFGFKGSDRNFIALNMYDIKRLTN